ncbi:Fe(II)-dependent oxygenase superfamily protein [uncultured Caudovirales phage]|uniref:Fe(II)-dependent oxygenase superfamily protein n=1 Tax=uncultured Caudovirales phage TaxID=2100421 RepID=A0A6J7WSA1_9CAUD|nr:Fe(II)-dependent oxygenase superfamily protein [uncultured Caudovirales phage]
MQAYPSWNLAVDEVQEWAFFENAISVTDCDEIIEYCRGLGLQDGAVFDGALKDVRKSKITFVPPTEFMIPHYQRLSAIILSLNTQFFKFDLHGFGENLQFTEYVAPSGKYDSHVDRAYGIAIRKLSIVLQLTDEDTYEGGDLELIPQIENPHKMPRKRGTLIAFPSFQLHRVTPVTKGTRNSLVGWVNGKQFR